MFDTSTKGISPMITVRTPKAISQPTLIGFEATLKTPHAIFEMSSSGPAVESNASVEGLYGRIAWPRALFRLGQRFDPGTANVPPVRLLGCGNILATSRQLDFGGT